MLTGQSLTRPTKRASKTPQLQIIKTWLLYPQDGQVTSKDKDLTRTTFVVKGEIGRVKLG